MTERIDNLVYETTQPLVQASTAEGEATLFLTGPAEFLVKHVALLLAADPVWAQIFGEFIDGYKRMDYPQRALPAMRVYNNLYEKQFESWWVEGDIIVDMIFPASLRRRDTQQIPDTVSAALLQQFRRRSFFDAIRAVVPAVNELGKKFRVDKSLAFEWGDNQLVPLTQVMINFKMDLREWDDYAESDNRTKDEPFDRPLGDLKTIRAVIQAVDDDGNVDNETDMDIEIP